jgi:glycosyltransferase involved in cell wall biosynthesis
MAGVSVFLMVRNEEQSIAACLDALHWSDDVVVLDSYSDDGTCAIAARYANVRIVERHFTDFGDQRCFGLHQIAYRNPWVLIVDADEIVSTALATEIAAVVHSEAAARRDVYCLRRTPWFDGRPLRHNMTASFWIPRLVRPGAVTISGRVHEQIFGRSDVGRLTAMLDHHQFDKGHAHWLDRRLRYARIEHAETVPADVAGWLADLRSTCHLKRRAAVKRAFKALPLRWMVYFVYNVVINSAWRDGWTGLRYVATEADSQRRADQMLRNQPC